MEKSAPFLWRLRKLDIINKFIIYKIYDECQNYESYEENQRNN